MNRPKIRVFTLMEVLYVIGVLVLLFATTGYFLFKGARVCRQCATKAFASQQLLVLKGQWRKFVRASDGLFFKVVDGGSGFSTNAGKVVFSDGSVVFTFPTGEKSSYKLAKGMSVEFAVECNDTGSVAIMNISMPGRGPMFERRARIVAAPGAMEGVAR